MPNAVAIATYLQLEPLRYREFAKKRKGPLAARRAEATEERSCLEFECARRYDIRRAGYGRSARKGSREHPRHAQATYTRSQSQPRIGKTKSSEKPGSERCICQLVRQLVDKIGPI